MEQSSSSKDDQKLDTNLDILPTLPALDQSTPVTHQARSHLVLLCSLLSLIALAWISGLDILQVSGNTSYKQVALGLGIIVGIGGMALHWTGSTSIDWYKMITNYWWLSMPVLGGTGLLLVMMQEGSSELRELS